MTKEELYNLILNCDDIPSEYKTLSCDEIIRLMFYWNHLTSNDISGKRLTPAGVNLFSRIQRPYEYETDVDVFKGKWIIILSNMLENPWFHEQNKLILFDKRIFCEIKLKGSFTSYMDSGTTKKYF